MSQKISNSFIEGDKDFESDKLNEILEQTKSDVKEDDSETKKKTEKKKDRASISGLLSDNEK